MRNIERERDTRGSVDSHFADEFMQRIGNKIGNCLVYVYSTWLEDLTFCTLCLSSADVVSPIR